MKIIVMLMPYFGKWPEWVNIYFESCRYNPTIDWLFFTDCGKPDNRPANVKFIEMTYEEFLRLAARRLEIELPQHDNVRKICDFKPTYGLIFEDYIKDYDFYGYGDIDLVYGNIRHFVDDSILKDYDIVSFHTGMISGHFALYRSCKHVMHMFKRIDQWPSLLQNTEYLRLDEDMFTSVIDRERVHFSEAYSTPSICRKWKDGTWNFPTEWYWRDGVVTNNKDSDEYLYFHFLFWKGDTNAKGWQHRSPAGGIVHGDWKNAPHGWKIDENGFHVLAQWPVKRCIWKQKASAIRSRITLEQARWHVRRKIEIKQFLQILLSGSGSDECHR